MKKQVIAISNFENVLEKSLLSKGYEYIEHVADLKLTNSDEYDQWQAKVRGTQTYRVTIQIGNTTGIIRLNSCTCPFEGPICKHQVAVLYSIGMEDQQQPPKPKTVVDKVSTILSQLTFEELKDYIKNLAGEDDKFKKHFLSTFAVKNSKTVEEFKKIIDQALRPLKVRHGFVHYQVFLHAAMPIEALLKKRAALPCGP